MVIDGSCKLGFGGFSETVFSEMIQATDYLKPL